MSGFARMAKRHSEQLINSVLNLEDLAECIMLSDVTGFIVEFDDPTGQIGYGVTEVPIRISYLNGTPFLRGRYVHRTHTLSVHAAGDDKENILFSLALATHSTRIKHPAAALAGPQAVEKKISSIPHQNEIAKIKHKTGLTIYRITRAAKPSWSPEKDDAYDLQVVKANQATIPFLDMRVEKTCCYQFLNWLGLTFHSAQYALYKRDQFIGTVRPKIGFGMSQIGYVVKFENVPSPAHISKTIVMASTITMLLNLGPINVGDDIAEE